MFFGSKSESSRSQSQEVSAGDWSSQPTPAPAPAPGTDVFGGAPSTTSSSGNVLGGFGGNAPAPSSGNLFGAPAPSTSNSFGAAPSGFSSTSTPFQGAGFSNDTGFGSR